MDTDILVGLRFELSGGVGKMAGDIVGRAGDLYLVQRDGVDHLELLELSDLRAARFYGKPGRASRSSPTETVLSGTAGPSSSDAGLTGQPPRLSDKIRRSVRAADGDDTAGG